MKNFLCHGKIFIIFIIIVYFSAVKKKKKKIKNIKKFKKKKKKKDIYIYINGKYKICFIRKVVLL